MSDFRARLLGLAGAAVIFSGMAFGQNLCQTSAALAVPSGAAFLRAEGQTELLPPIQVTCSTGTAAGTANIQLFFSPAVTVTSAIVTSSSGATEAVAAANGGGTSAPGIITPGGITFTGITTSATTTTFTITNIRVNATAIPSTVGSAPTPVSATAFIAGTNVTPSSTGTGVPVAYALNGLSPSKEYSDNGGANAGKVIVAGTSLTSFGICNPINASGTASPNFFVSVVEGFQNSFKTKAEETSPTGAPDSPSFGTRIAVTFTNVPSGLSIYLPTSVTTGGLTLAAISSPTATSATNTPTVATSPSSVNTGGLYFVPSSSGTATAWFEVMADNPGAIDTGYIGVTLYATANSISAQSTMLTVATSFAPITGATTIPSFAAGSSTVPLGFLSFTACTTSLLFPFVSNAAGFETGIAIANTTVDPFGGVAQSGTCTLNFYGTGGTNPKPGPAPNPNEGSGKPFNGGETYAFTLTSALAAAASGNPATFTGYIIAQCGFQEAHGFAYITYAFPGTSSDSMGYVANVLTRGSVGPESLGQ
jgi:hypothetical protein